MKNSFTIILLGWIFCLSSCSNKDNKTSNYIVVPSTDSVSKGSTVDIILGTSTSVDTFSVTDLVVTGSPVEFLYASDTFDINDSIWMARILVTDYHLKQFGLNLSLISTAPVTIDTGYYFVTDNRSTFTDYSKGENKTYTVTMGSYIHITRSYSPITGTISLNLYYNHATASANGSFRIFR